MTRFSVGDKVRYADSYLRSTHQNIGDLPLLRGKVTVVDNSIKPQLVTVKWQLNGKPHTFGYSEYEGRIHIATHLVPAVDK